MNTWRKIEITFYIIAIAIVLSFPFFDHPSESQHYWLSVWNDIKRFLPFILIFLLNAEILVPKFLLNKKYIQYFSAVVFSISAVMLFLYFLNYNQRPPNAQNQPLPVLPHFQEEQRNDRRQPPPQRRDNDNKGRIQPPPQRRNNDDQRKVQPPPQRRNNDDQRKFQPPPERQQRQRQNELQRPPRRPDGQDQFQHPPVPIQRHIPPRKLNIWLFNHLLLNVLVVGLGTGIKISYYWFQNERVKKDLEKENLKSELAFLKTQISPHFFLNTLNNIHALTEIDVKEAQKAILELSKMMRYLLYESEQGNTTLEKEIEFLKSYIDLMRRRIDDMVEIKIDFPDDIEKILIPPLLFISFIENAFKYGVSYKNKSYIHIELMLISNTELLFTCTNSQHESEVRKTKASGIGLVNIKKRLDLLYKDTYSLKIDSNDEEYKTILKIPINEN